MTYGHSTTLPDQNAASRQAPQALAARAVRRPWRTLPADSRLAVVERALKPANDFIDAYPIAL